MNIPIKNQALLDTALTHRSYLNEHRSVKEHNERLEYLGDAVIELAVSEFIYKKYQDKPEGDLTAIRSAMVRTETLAKMSRLLNFGQQLRMSKGEEASGGKDSTALLANTFEAVIGALYLDQGFQTTVEYLRSNLFKEVDEIVEKGLYKDFKSTLQETVQSEGKSTPEYEVIDETGPDHEKTFTVQVKVDGVILASGEGKSKQVAQQQAASGALEKMTTS